MKFLNLTHLASGNPMIVITGHVQAVTVYDWSLSGKRQSEWVVGQHSTLLMHGTTINVAENIDTIGALL